MASPNQLTRFLLDECDVRGETVRLSSEWREMMFHADYPHAVKQLLGEAVAATSLLAATVKFEGAITLQIQGNGAVPLLVVQVNSDYTLRGTASYVDSLLDELVLTQKEKSLPSFQQLIGEGGRVVITIEMGDDMQDYQGVVPAEGERLQDAIAYYFEHSEQLPTRLWLASSDEAVAGLLLQRLPEENAPSMDDEQESWQRVCLLGDTVKPEELLELPSETLLYRLFNEETVRVYPPHTLRFQCTCSREKTGAALKSLGRDDAMQLAKEQGEIVVDCQFCKKQYAFDVMAIAELFSNEQDNNQTSH